MLAPAVWRTPRAWFNPVLAVLVLCGIYLCLAGHATNSLTEADPARAGMPMTAAVAAEGPDHVGAPDHEHGSGGVHLCDGAGFGIDKRAATSVLFALVLLGAAITCVLWRVPQPFRSRWRRIHRHIAPRSGARLLISLCICRV